MNSLYHRFAVASVSIALGFALGANKEARAAMFTFTPTYSYWVVDYNQDGVVDYGAPFSVPRYVGRNDQERPGLGIGEYRSFYNFNIADLHLDSNTRITRATFQTRVLSVLSADPHDSSVRAYGFTEEYPPFTDNGEWLNGYDELYKSNRILTFNILPFVVNQKINNNNSFALSIRPSTEAFFSLSSEATLTITTVPEPTTVFGSALALGVGGWLKRKKSS
jgi:hypothetical protein